MDGRWGAEKSMSNYHHDHDAPQTPIGWSVVRFDAQRTCRPRPSKAGIHLLSPRSRPPKPRRHCLPPCELRLRRRRGGGCNYNGFPPSTTPSALCIAPSQHAPRPPRDIARLPACPPARLPIASHACCLTHTTPSIPSIPSIPPAQSVCPPALLSSQTTAATGRRPLCSYGALLQSGPCKRRYRLRDRGPISSRVAASWQP